jgi:hypothetical protein
VNVPLMVSLLALEAPGGPSCVLSEFLTCKLSFKQAA